MTISLVPVSRTTLAYVSAEKTDAVKTPSTATPAANEETPEQTTQPKTSAPVAQASRFKQALADKINLSMLGRKLDEVAKRLGADATPQTMLAALKTTPMAIHPDSLYYAGAGGNATLESFISSLGLYVPTDPFALTSLSDAVIARSQEHPLGNQGGALSWPVPLSADEQRRLKLMTMNYADPLGNKAMVMQTKGLLLEFLRHRTPLSPDVLKDPANALNGLISSPEAQLMGKALQEQMQGVATDSSGMDYLLAALALQLDPESITAPSRNTVAGFDLASNKHWGKPASEVVDALGKHLVKQGKTSPELAGAGAHLLLASRAPVFLIKDIPGSVTYGSPAWVNLAVAAATIDAQTPGKVANMTFAQVMLEAESASLADPAVTATVQREALIDWGVANGVLGKKNDREYTADELTTLVTTFNDRKSLMTSASQALDKDIPSRREMALAELKKRFPGQEALFEEKLIHVSREVGTAPNVKYRTVEVGPHSLLDIAMMDLAGTDLVYSSLDSRVPLAELNANPRFGVAKPFEAQFNSVIEEKKDAIGTYITHLVSQLPWEDQKKFHYGKMTFYQNHSHTLGTGFLGKTHHPKGEELLVSIEHNGVTSPYKISFNDGGITPVPKWMAAPRSRREANVVHETKVFVPKNGKANLENEQTPPSGGRLDSFTSDRVKHIADAFVEHVNLDDPALKQQARGLTTADKNHGRADVVSDFILDLIPFRSAINNFIKGDVGDGLLDLGLDIFGFLTAGAATAGKVVKIAGTAVSAASKVARAAKAIGMATFSTLNPLGGLGDLAVGGAKFVGKGFNKATEWINTLRAASGNSDLLKAISQEHGTALIGSFKAGERNIDGVAVLKNDQWYHYDPVLKQPYGSPIRDFKPIGAPRPLVNGGTNTIYGSLQMGLRNAQTPKNINDFNRGVSRGSTQDLPGYSSNMSADELRTLASKNALTPEQMGILARELKALEIQNAQYASRVLYNDVYVPGVKVTPVSQLDYLAHVDLSSKGECAGLSNLMALAIHSGKDDIFMQNLYRAARNPTDADAAEFIQELNNLQRAVGQKTTFHMGKPSIKKDHQSIIDDLTNSSTSKTLRIGTKDHGMIAGITVEPGKTEWFFYEPNSGMVKFDTLASMQNGMEKVLNSGGIAANLNAYGSKRGAREYYVSEFSPNDLKAANVYTLELADMINNPL